MPWDPGKQCSITARYHFQADTDFKYSFSHRAGDMASGVSACENLSSNPSTGIKSQTGLCVDVTPALGGVETG